MITGLVSTKKPCATCFGTDQNCIDCRGNGWVERRAKRGSQMIDGEIQESQHEESIDKTLPSVEVLPGFTSEETKRMSCEVPNESVIGKSDNSWDRNWTAEPGKSIETSEEWEIFRDEIRKIYPKSTAEFNPVVNVWAIASHSLDPNIHHMGLMLSDGWLPSEGEAWLSAWENVQKTEKNPETEKVIEVNQEDTPPQIPYAGGNALSTKIPAFHLIPTVALEALAKRFEKGIERKGDKAWNALSPNQSILTDREFAIERIAHIIHHCMKLRDKLIAGGDNPFEGDDDAGAIIWGGAFLCSVKQAMKEQNEQQ